MWLCLKWFSEVRCLFLGLQQVPEPSIDKFSRRSSVSLSYSGGSDVEREDDLPQRECEKKKSVRKSDGFFLVHASALRPFHNPEKKV